MCNFESLYADLILACEDFSPEDFEKYHCFYKYEENIIAQLMAHGPVLLKGGRGAGKSALLREADRRLKLENSSACGIYLSLRHLPLLRSQGKQYEDEFLRNQLHLLFIEIWQINLASRLKYLNTDRKSVV